MMKSVSALAITMALSMTAAVAKDLKQDKAPTAPAVKAKVMTDAEMDMVSGGTKGELSGSNTARNNGFFTGASFNADGGLGNALSHQGGGIFNSEPKPPQR